MSVIVIGGVITSLVQQAVERTQRFGQEVTDAYNETLSRSGASAGDTSNPINPLDPAAPEPPVRPPLEEGQNRRAPRTGLSQQYSLDSLQA
jgi:hypothetical protein